MKNTNNPVLDHEVENGTQPTFTADWFTRHIPIWEHFGEVLPSRSKFLEIGSFEGMSACWLLENLLAEDGELYCIDTWKGSPEFSDLPPNVMANALKLFDENTALVRRGTQKILKFQNESIRGLADLIHAGHGGTFDFVYVDGGHFARETLTDACMAWPLLKVGGVMVFDDYLWQLAELPLDQRPKLGIDAFASLFNEQIETLAVGDQYVVRKKAA